MDIYLVCAVMKRQQKPFQITALETLDDAERFLKKVQEIMPRSYMAASKLYVYPKDAE